MEAQIQTLGRRMRALFGRRPSAVADARRPLAVVTMAYNEADMLPFWLRHYAEQVGLSDCYILDHGSTDGSTDGVGAHIVRLPRSELDEPLRAAMVSDFCAALLRNYSAVLYTDTDELVIADPLVAPSLLAFAQRPGLPEIITAIGLDVVQDEADEGPLDPEKPITAQREWFWATPSLCKPTFIRKPNQWHAGFHLVHETAEFAGLYLLHIAYADMGLAARRQVRRNQSPPRVGGDHHRLAPEAIVGLVRNQIPWGRRKGVTLNGCQAELEFRSMITVGNYGRCLDVWRIPDRFRG